MKEVSLGNVTGIMFGAFGIIITISIIITVMTDFSMSTAWLDGYCAEKDTGVYNIIQYKNETMLEGYYYDNVTCANGNVLIPIETTI